MQLLTMFWMCRFLMDLLEQDDNQRRYEVSFFRQNDDRRTKEL